MLVLAALWFVVGLGRTPAYAADAPQPCTPAGSERVRTDQARYPHFDTVHITGSGYAPGCTVTVRVTRPDGSVVVGDGSETPGSDTVVTSSSGRLAYEYRLSDIDGYYRIDVIGAGGTVLAAREFADAFGISKLTLNNKNGSENYVYTVGNTVVLAGSVDPADSTHAGRAYRMVFKAPSGAVRSTTTCTRDGAKGADVSASLTIAAGDPISTGSTWSAVLEQYLDAACTNLEKTASLPFAVASSRAFGDAGLTTGQDFFKLGATPFVTVAGLTPSRADWSTAWIRSGGATACQNTAGADRPDADASGLLRSGSGAFLQYPPGPTGSTWNLQASYDGGCAAATSANQGAWTVKLTADATHFVTLPAFTVDATSPVSSATAPATGNGSGVTVSYTASDTGTGASGLAKVDLFAKAPGASTYANVATDAAPGASGSFSFVPAQGSGSYSFYTVATDKAGNAEAAPAVADSTTSIDSAPPVSQAAAPATATAAAWNVTYTAADPGTGATGLAKVQLFVKGPGESGYAVAATDSAPGASGSFAYTATNGDGRYSFYTLATDKAGNAEAAPAGPDAITALDRAQPAASASSPGYATQSPFTVGYTASDPGADASGLAKVELFAKGPGDAGYVKVAVDSSPGASGSFSFAGDVDGTFAFYALATDQAGNVQAVPAGADTTTVLDRAAPVSGASVGVAFETSSTFSVGYTASDPGSRASGLDTVELYAKGPGDTGFVKVATDSSPSASGSLSYQAPADGGYAFYTVARDKAGNAEDPPAGADTLVTVDTAAPTSHASSPASVNANGFTVSYTASDPGTASGLATVELFAKGPRDAAYAKVASDSTPTASGSFTYAATEGRGDYSFYTVATDNAGNVEDAPADADTTTTAGGLETTPPTASATSPGYATQSPFTVGYAASDPGADASGLASVDLYAKGPGDAEYAKVATDSTPGATGSFSFDAGSVDGTFSFYALATDKAGNGQSAPSGADSTTVVDRAAPASGASVGVAFVTSSTVSVGYSASDPGSGASGLAKIELFAKGPGDAVYAKVATDSSPGASGSLSYTVPRDGVYAFYTVATDKAGNAEGAPAGADTLVTVDTAAPTSQAASPTHAATTGFTVSYAADDPGSGASGLAKVELYVKGPADSGYGLADTDTTPGASGSFAYVPGEGDGDYAFYTRAVDNAGNRESAPAGADSTTSAVTVDKTPPTANATSPAYSASNSFALAYSASDTGTGATGVAKVELFARPPGSGSFTKVATDTSGGASGSFDYVADAGDGRYAFYAVATDVAGNAQSAPANPDTATTVDTSTPTSSATSTPYATASPVTVSYTSADAGASASGVAQVDLYAKPPGGASYAKVATDPSPGASGSFSFTATQGNGTYAFYTVASDAAGNAEAAPTSADTTTKIDPGVGQVEVVDEVHYTYTGSTSVGFSWRGDAQDIRYGTTSSYGTTAKSHTPTPLPPSSPGPFQEVELTGLDAGATYHYSIGGGPDHTFSTAPTGSFRFDVEADVGSTAQFSKVGITQDQIAADDPAFVLVPGDLTYGHPYGPTAVDTHFNDVMKWSKKAAYMPAWGNHEYEDPSNDDLRNYKGRFILPHAQTSVGAPATGCCGDDWSWFDAGNVRFIAYPDPYTSKTLPDWQANADAIFSAAQADPNVHFIVTFGHRPAYSTGLHAGEATISTALNDLGDKYDKYRLNINGHSHDYERFQPIHGVTHVTTGGGGAPLEPPWLSADSRTVLRAMHLQHLRVDVSPTGMRVDAICGPATSADDVSCVEGSVLDSFTLGTAPPPPPPVANTLYVAKNDPNCTNAGSGTQAQPFCAIGTAAARVIAGQTVRVAGGTYNERISLSSSGTAAAPINFVAAQGETVTVNGGTNGFYTNGKAYVTIQGFKVTGTTQDAIVVSKSSSHITIRGNEVSNAGQRTSGLTARGIRVDITNDDLIENNTVHDNSDYGIYVVGGSTRNVITGNHVYGNARGFERAASGIRIHDSIGNTISGNFSHDNEDSGIELVTGSQNNLVINNVIYDNGDHGIDDTGNSPNNSVIGNTVYRSVTSGIDFEGGATGSAVYNNIAVDNGINSPRTKGNIRVESTSVSGTTLDYNLVYLSVPGQRNYEWGLGYNTLLEMQAASGQEMHAIEADPKFASLANDDFRLSQGSPAIDSANSGIPGAPSSDAHDSARIDDPLSANMGVGPRTYDDRGALEYEPQNHAPLSAVSVTPASGAFNLNVTADASASVDNDGLSPIASYTFDFGDGSNAVGPQASAIATHTYTTPGTYTVAVTVTDTAGLKSKATASVTVRDDPPTAAVTATPSSGPGPLHVTANASASSDTDASPIATYSFEWGDGSPATGEQSSPTSTHTYADTGDYDLTVTVKDTAGNTSTKKTLVRVFGSNVPPAAALSVSPSTGDLDLAVTADASASTDPDDGIASYSFSWGDGSDPTGSQSSPTATHTYRRSGTFTVTVTVTDQGGGSSQETKQVVVTDSPPVARLALSPSSGLAPLDVAADASASTDVDGTPIASYSFDWGDNSPPTGAQASAAATHTYAAAGTYTVTVTVTDVAGLSTTRTAPVTAKPNLVTNPGFESALTGWNTSGSITGVTLTRISGGHSGTSAAQLANGSTSTGICVLNDSPNWVTKTVAGKYTASIWVKGATTGATIKAKLTEFNGATNLGSATATATLTTSWQKLSVDYTPVSPGSTLDFNAYVSSATPGTCFFADDVAIWLP